MSPRVCIALGAFLAALAVGLGAFGAHWLRSRVGEWYPDSVVAARMLDTWETGVWYQFYSAFGLILLGLWANHVPGQSITVSASAMLVGAAIFSGCLYLLVLTGQRVLGAVVPIGGIAMIFGWLLFAWQAWQAVPPGN